MRMTRAAQAIAVLLMLTAVQAAAQTCRGATSFTDGRIRYGGGASGALLTRFSGGSRLLVELELLA